MAAFFRIMSAKMRTIQPEKVACACTLCLLLASIAVRLWAQDSPESILRVDVIDAQRGDEMGSVVEWTLPLEAPLPARIPVAVDVVLVSRLEPCFSDPSLCSGGEDFFDEEGDVHGCADGIDNDDDGRLDAEELECSRGVTGWSFSIATDACFGVAAATTRGTAGDLDLRPPGLRDSEGGSFEKTELVDPERNGGQEGVVSAVILSFTNHRDLAAVSELPVARIRGALDSATLAAAGPCVVRVLDATHPGLVGSGEPVRTALSVHGVSHVPATRGAAISVVLDTDPAPARFRRGDVDVDDAYNITDGVVVLRFLFRGGVSPACHDAADTDDSGNVELTDAVLIFNHLFLGGEPPLSPGPHDCDRDPTPDELGCARFEVCP